MEDLPHHPFVIEHQRWLEKSGRFVPAARLIVTPALRQSGLLSLLSDRQARLLLALLTYTSPNGQVQATAKQVAAALGIPAPIVSFWLSHFASRRFHGAHLIYAVKREEGLPYFALSRGAIMHEHGIPVEPDTRTPLRLADRAEVIAHSRDSYGTPRAEVERVVMEQLGHAAEELLDTPEGAVWRGLRALHMDKEEIRALIVAYGPERILQQLSWLPARGAKNPARYLLAAIAGNYAAPGRTGDSRVTPRSARNSAGRELQTDPELTENHE